MLPTLATFDVIEYVYCMIIFVTTEGRGKDICIICIFPLVLWIINTHSNKHLLQYSCVMQNIQQYFYLYPIFTLK